MSLTRLRLLIGILAIAGTSRGFAQITVSLPLQGHFRAGRYMPVRVKGIGQGGDVLLQARNAVPTALKATGELNVVVPWLALSDSVRDAQLTDGSGRSEVSLSLQPLEANEKLIAFAGVASDGARDLFPGSNIVPISLDLTGPLLEPVVAWETLDGVVFNRETFPRVDSTKLSAILSAGTLVAVRSVKLPDAQWPWEHLGEFWVLRPLQAGPNEAIEANAYEPTYGWERGWPGSFRRAVIGGAAIYCILAAALALWRSRWAVIGFIALSSAAAGFVAWRYDRQSPVLDRTAAVWVVGEHLAQMDQWIWQSPVRPADVNYPFVLSTKPVFATLRQPVAERMRLVCRSDGTPQQFVFHLDSGQSQAMRMRITSVPPTLVQSPPIEPWLNDFASELYQKPGDRIVNAVTALSADAIDQPTVVIQIPPH